MDDFDWDRWGPQILSEYRKADRHGQLCQGDTVQNFEQGFIAAVNIINRLEANYQASQEGLAKLALTIEKADAIIYRGIRMFHMSGYTQEKDSNNPIRKWIFDAMNYKGIAKNESD